MIMKLKVRGSNLQFFFFFNGWRRFFIELLDMFCLVVSEETELVWFYELNEIRIQLNILEVNGFYLKIMFIWVLEREELKILLVFMGY